MKILIKKSETANNWKNIHGQTIHQEKLNIAIFLNPFRLCFKICVSRQTLWTIKGTKMRKFNNDTRFDALGAPDGKTKFVAIKK